MDLSLADIGPFLLNSQLSEVEHIKNLKLLSKNFTSERVKCLNEYQFNTDLISSYALFYFPTNIPKFDFIISRLTKSEQMYLKQCQFIDVGTGPGTYLYAFLNWAKTFSLNHVAVDQSQFMLQQAEKLLRGLLPAFNCTFTQIAPAKISAKSLLFFGHSLNEMGLKNGLQYIDKLNPEYVFTIEPGTKETFSFILKLRKEMALRNYAVLYPCAHLNSSCPLEERDDWCHQILRTQHHESIERLSQLINKDRRTMPLIAHLYKRERKKISSESDYKHRLVRLVKETKFSWIWDVCMCEDPLRLQRIEVLKSEFSKSQQKEIKNISSGIGINFDPIKEMQDFCRVTNVHLDCWS